MKCSLLTLSTYLDGELDARKRGEVDAHLVGCERCQLGVAHLREESTQIGELARVHVGDQSARMLLAQLGLEPTPPPSAPNDVHLTGASAQQSDVAEPAQVPTAVAAWANGLEVPPPPPSLADLGKKKTSFGLTLDITPLHMDERWAGPLHAPSDGGSDVFAHTVPEVEATVTHEEISPMQDVDTPPAHISPEEPFSADDEFDLTVAHPVKVVRTGLFTRIWDGIATRRALAQSTRHFDESVQIVSGFGAPKPVEHVREHVHREQAHREEVQRGHVEHEQLVGRRQESHSEPEPQEVVSPPPVRKRERPPLGQTVRGMVAPVTRVASEQRSYVAVGGVIVALMLFGLVTGESKGPLPVASTSTKQNPTVALPATPSQSAKPTAAPTSAPTPPPAAAAVVLSDVRTLGDSGTGFQVKEIRYGTHPNDFRVVFDLAPADASATGIPHTTIGFIGQDKLIVVFDGVVAAGSTGSLSDTSVVTAVDLVQPAPKPGEAAYQFTLARPVTLTNSYLDGPLRLVLDFS